MPALGLLLFNLLSSVAAFFALWVGKKVALVLAVVLFLVALTTAFVASIDALIGSISVAIPSGLLISASWFLPDNALACLSAVISALIIRWVYDWNTKIVQLKLL